MGWQFTEDVETYCERVGPLLKSDPVANTVPLTILAHLRAGGTSYDGYSRPILLGWYDDPDAIPAEPSGAVLMTPPFELLLAVVPDEAMQTLAEALRANGTIVPGANGVVDVVDRFSTSWLAGTSQRAETRLRIRLYALESLLPPPHPTDGRARLATEADTDQAVDWFHAFHDEVGGHEPDVASSVMSRIADRRMWLWEDESGAPVSLAARQQTAAGVARVGPVYTPPDRRGRGYGAAVTAACTAAALTDADQVVLFTDLANPTSNAIYQQLGYRPVSDRQVVHFVD